MPTYSRSQIFGHPLDPDARVVITLTDADLHIEGVDGDQVQVNATFEIRAATEAEADAIFEAAQLRVSSSARNLQLEQPDRHVGFHGLGHAVARIFGGSDVECEVRVELPHATDLRVATVSGDIDAQRITSESRIESVSGDVTFTDGAGMLRLNTVSGDAQVRAGGSLGVRAESVSGDIGITVARLEMLRATTVSGDIDLDAELAASGEFRAETVSGDLTIGLVGAATFDVRGLSTDISSDLDHRVEGRLDRRRLVVGSGGPEFIFSSMSGDLAVRRPRRLRDARPPTPVAPPAPPAPPRPPAAQLGQSEQLEILQALERGEIDVDEATRRLSGESSGG